MVPSPSGEERTALNVALQSTLDVHIAIQDDQQSETWRRFRTTEALMETTTIGAAACFVWRWSNSRKGRRIIRYRLETDCCSRGIVNFAGEGYSIRAQEFTSRMGNAADRTASTELNWKNTSRAYLNRFLGKYRNTGEPKSTFGNGRGSTNSYFVSAA